METRIDKSQDWDQIRTTSWKLPYILSCETSLKVEFLMIPGEKTKNKKQKHLSEKHNAQLSVPGISDNLIILNLGKLSNLINTRPASIT